jgi:hypothetical protein
MMSIISRSIRSPKTLLLLFGATLTFFGCQSDAVTTTDATATDSLVSHIPGDTVMLSADKDRFAAIGVQDPTIVEHFVRDLKTALQHDDVPAIANMCIFPLRLNLRSGATKSRHETVNSVADFQKNYNTIFTASAKTAIINQESSDLFANYQGLKIGDTGEAWAQYDVNTQSLKIFSINVGD